MNPCADDAVKLDYLNGTLPDRKRTVFETHLAVCPACRLEVAGLRETAAAIAALTPPPVPAAWVDAAKERLRAEAAPPVFAGPSGADPICRWTLVVRYAAIAVTVMAGLALLVRLAVGGTIAHWLPGVSPAAQGISEPSAARALGLVAWVVSLHALVLVPSIVDNLYLLTLGAGRRP